MSVQAVPLLDHWSPPPDAGAPVAIVATTFTLEGEFVDRDCLSRFLSVSAVEESVPGAEALGDGKPTSRSVDDVVARLELEEKLADTAVTVIADRSADAHRSTLRWDLLQVAVSGGALLHSKVTVLLWENSARVIIGSANLTRAGYRSQAELALAAEIRPDVPCLLPQEDLHELVDELESYLELLPGGTAGVAAVDRARRTLAIFRDRIELIPAPGRSALRVRLAPTSPDLGPLDRFPDVWRGGRKATHIRQVSPYYDAHSDAAGEAIRRATVARNGAGRHEHVVLTLPDYAGAISVSEPLRDRAERRLLEVRLLDDPSGDQRRKLHAKCLSVTGPDGTAVLVGSSNHTRAGLGLGGTRRHRELNVWLHARAGSREEKRLKALTPVGETVPDDLDRVHGDDEDEVDAPTVPLAFEQVIARRGPDGDWTLTCTVDPAALEKVSAAGPWRVLDPTDTEVMTSAQWVALGSPGQWVAEVLGDLPTSLTVTTVHGTARWSVLVDDRGALPPGPSVKDLTTAQLLAALARGRTLSAALAEVLAERLTSDQDYDDDVLSRYDDPALLFRRGRALGAGLDQLEDRLSRRLNEVDPMGHLSSRLRSPMGPLGLAEHVLADVASGQMDTSEAVFTLAEIALAVGRVPWLAVLPGKSVPEGADVLAAAFAGVEQALDEVGEVPADLRGYAVAAIERSRGCLTTLSGA